MKKLIGLLLGVVILVPGFVKADGIGLQIVKHDVLNTSAIFSTVTAGVTDSTATFTVNPLNAALTSIGPTFGAVSSGFENSVAGLTASQFTLPAAWSITLSGQNLSKYHYHHVPHSSSVPAPVPEPATIILLGAGLLGLGAVTRKRRKT
jgi:PEP-CTERM motif